MTAIGDSSTICPYAEEYEATGGDVKWFWFCVPSLVEEVEENFINMRYTECDHAHEFMECPIFVKTHYEKEL